MPKSATIFLSYVREDVHRVEWLYQELVSAGFIPWMDTRDLLGGGAFTVEPAGTFELKGLTGAREVFRLRA